MTGTIGVGAQHLPREQRHRKLAELVRERIAIMNGELAARANAGTSAGNLLVRRPSNAGSAMPTSPSSTPPAGSTSHHERELSQRRVRLTHQVSSLLGHHPKSPSTHGDGRRGSMN